MGMVILCSAAGCCEVARSRRKILETTSIICLIAQDRSVILVCLCVGRGTGNNKTAVYARIQKNRIYLIVMIFNIVYTLMVFLMSRSFSTAMFLLFALGLFFYVKVYTVVFYLFT